MIAITENVVMTITNSTLVVVIFVVVVIVKLH